ncbi:MAG: O-antigen ligase family protein [Candidatus Dormibacteria bacterium]
MTALAVTGTSVAEFERLARLRARIAAGAGVILAVLLGLAVGVLSSGRSFLVIFLAVPLALPFIWWKRPATGVLTLLACATMVEQFEYSVGIPGLDAFTDKIPLYTSLSSGFGASGLVMSPIDIAVVLLLVVWLTRAATDRSLRLPRTQVAATLGVLVLLAGVALLRALAAGGTSADNTAALWEVRPWIYLGATFLFASQMIRSRRAVQAVLWAFVLGSGFKALQGVYIFLGTRNEIPRPEAILGHEESIFFSLFIILTLCLWVYRQRGWLRFTATALLPFVIIADVGNTRRDAFLILAAELLVMVILVYAALPERRRLIRRVVATSLVVFALYLPVEWNGSGTLASVAVAVRSGIAPDARDAQSNGYRVAEDANLGVMIKQNPLLGTGFGVPINYSSYPIVDISNIDSMIAYVPHNGVLYVWMRMGILGEVALWMFVAAAILAGTRAARSPDKLVSLIGTLTACTAVGWVIMGYTDMGFWWFRIAIAFGCLLGVLHAVTVMERSAAGQDAVPGRA